MALCFSGEFALQYVLSMLLAESCELARKLVYGLMLTCECTIHC